EERDLKVFKELIEKGSDCPEEIDLEQQMMEKHSRCIDGCSNFDRILPFYYNQSMISFDKIAPHGYNKSMINISNMVDYPKGDCFQICCEQTSKQYPELMACMA
ncbi:hypothetical protein LCGC14_1399530, partial [marine sediment metagenome]